MCRRSDLEKKRRCGFIDLDDSGGGRPVWARADVATETCPKSYVTAESVGLVEDFLVRRRLGSMNFEQLTARQAEAFLILDKALAKERAHGEQRGRHAV